jgi:hypothetical protein
MKETASETMNANGLLTNQNLFYDKEADFTIELYNKPTYFNNSALKTFSSGYYISITEKRTTGDLYCLKANGSFDIVGKDSTIKSEGTNNIVPISDARWNINKKDYQGTVTVTTATSGKTTSARFDFAPRLTGSGSAWQVAQYNLNLTWDMSKTYTFSVYMKRNTSDVVSITLRDSNGLNQQGANINASGNVGQWQRYSMTWNPTMTSGGGVIYMTAAQTASFEVADPQIEISDHPTLFVNGSRNYVGGLASGNATAITHMDDRIATLFNNGSTGNLVISDESCVQISKYTITDTDYINALSIAYDYVSKIYVLNKYGKVFTTDPTNGTTTLIYQFSDYATNQSSGLAKYKGLHSLNNFMGMTINNTIAYFDSNFNLVFATDIQPNAIIDGIVAISHGYASGDFYMLTGTKIIKMFPNTCGVDIATIKNIIKNGFVQITNENNYALNVNIKSMDITRKRNKQDARYEIKLSGRFV